MKQLHTLLEIISSVYPTRQNQDAYSGLTIMGRASQPLNQPPGSQCAIEHISPIRHRILQDTSPCSPTDRRTPYNVVLMFYNRLEVSSVGLMITTFDSLLHVPGSCPSSGKVITHR